MIRLIRTLIALACLAAGIVVGALNPQPALLDFGFTRVGTSLGVVVLALQQRLRRAEQSTRIPPRIEEP